MNLLRTIQLLCVWTLVLLCGGCGETFHQVIFPNPPNPPDPSSLHFVLSLSRNGSADPGASTRIDVSGDTNVGVATTGSGPVHAALAPDNTTVFVANSQEDTVSSYSSSNATQVTTTSLPTILINGVEIHSVPVFVASTQGGTMYVANYGTGTVSAISTFNGGVTKTISVGSFDPAHPAGPQPVAMAGTPDGQKLYVANQGNGTVVSINMVDRTANPPITVGSAPSWIVARSDSARVYVLNSGDGSVSTINTTDDTVATLSPTAGAGTNFMFYDKRLNRIYVTNPSSTNVDVLDVSGNSATQLFSLDLTTIGSTPTVCATGCVPTSVTVLPDGSRAYVAVYTISGTTINSYVFVADTLSHTVTKVVSLGSAALDPVNPVGCDTSQFPNAARFRLFTVVSADGSRVYVSNCDAGTTTTIRTAPNTAAGVSEPADSVVLSLLAPFSSFSGPDPQNPSSTRPPRQNPVFLVAGP